VVLLLLLVTWNGNARYENAMEYWEVLKLSHSFLTIDIFKDFKEVNMLDLDIDNRGREFVPLDCCIEFKGCFR
jgi:hypothetical protein